MEKTNVIIGLVAVPSKTAQILKVISDPKKKIVVVLFTDGSKEIVKCSAEDEFDVYVGVAIAEARHKYGTTSKFHKIVDDVLTIVKTKKAKKKIKPVPMGPIAPGQEPVRRLRKPRTTNKKGSK